MSGRVLCCSPRCSSTLNVDVWEGGNWKGERVGGGGKWGGKREWEGRWRLVVHQVPRIHRSHLHKLCVHQRVLCLTWGEHLGFAVHLCAAVCIHLCRSIALLKKDALLI